MKRRGLALAASLAMAAIACARQGAPPGGPEDRRPPLVVTTVPDTFADVGAVDDFVLIRFNERISERPTVGTLDDAVLVSPLTGEVRVEYARDALEVSLSGGYRPGLVYRVSVLPVISDMFGNTMSAPFEFLFSTGAPFTPNVVAGLLLERTTGMAAQGYRVRARSIGPGADSTLIHVAVSDTGGFFALRYLPPGRYELTAFEDLDRDRTIDFAEARGVRGLFFRDADTVIVELGVLRPDTTAARLLRVEPVDSTTLRLEFDDWLDPEIPTRNVGLALELDTLAPSGAPPAPGVERVVHARVFEAHADSLGIEAGAPGEPAAPAPAGRVPAPGRVPTAPGQQRGMVAGKPLPAHDLYVLLSAPLPANVPYRVTVTGVTNLNQIPFGGGEAALVRSPPAADTLAQPAADTSGTAS